MKGMCFNFF